jgi:hypothetical protein
MAATPLALRRYGNAQQTAKQLVAQSRSGFWGDNRDSWLVPRTDNANICFKHDDHNYRWYHYNDIAKYDYYDYSAASYNHNGALSFRQPRGAGREHYAHSSHNPYTAWWYR